jgi:formylglycine-generating enzyme required for sulfatase activity
MKINPSHRVFLLQIILIISFVLRAFFPLLSQEKARDLERQWMPVNEHLLIHQFETSNREYKIFLNSIFHEVDADFFQTLLIDSNNWCQPHQYCEPFVVYYHQHPAYADFPVVNIDINDAMEYCKWLTHWYHEQSRRKYKKIIVRLPTEQEWMQAASCGDSLRTYAWPHLSLNDRHKQPLCNYRQPEDQFPLHFEILAPVKSYKSNECKLYNMCGNAAEMIINENYSKGGSWVDEAKYLEIKNRKPRQENSNPYTGFRYVIEIIEE